MNPPQSPDLNISEAVWGHLDRERNERQSTSKEELWKILQEAWRTIPEDYCIHIFMFENVSINHCLKSVQTRNKVIRKITGLREASSTSNYLYNKLI